MHLTLSKYIRQIRVKPDSLIDSKQLIEVFDKSIACVKSGVYLWLIDVQDEVKWVIIDSRLLMKYMKHVLYIDEKSNTSVCGCWSLFCEYKPRCVYDGVVFNCSKLSLNGNYLNTYLGFKYELCPPPDGDLLTPHVVKVISFFESLLPGNAYDYLGKWIGSLLVRPGYFNHSIVFLNRKNSVFNTLIEKLLQGVVGKIYVYCSPRSLNSALKETNPQVHHCHLICSFKYSDNKLVDENAIQLLNPIRRSSIFRSYTRFVLFVPSETEYCRMFNHSGVADNCAFIELDVDFMVNTTFADYNIVCELLNVPEVQHRLFLYFTQLWVSSQG